MSRQFRRIVSLLPSATEWLGFLGYSDRLVGISHECDVPPEVMHLPRVTASAFATDGSCREIDQQVKQHCESQQSLYRLNAPLLVELQPDVIVTQSLCGVCAVSQGEVADIAAALGCELIDLHAQTFQQVLEEAATLSQVLGNGDVSQIRGLNTRIDRIRQASKDVSGEHPKVTLLEWTDPPFCSGHWTPELIQWAGAVDPIGVIGGPSRQITFAELQQADPDLLLVACCGMNLWRTRAEWEAIVHTSPWRELNCVQNDQVHLFDGSAYFNRSGPRLVDALEQVATLVRGWKTG